MSSLVLIEHSILPIECIVTVKYDGKGYNQDGFNVC